MCRVNFKIMQFDNIWRIKIILGCFFFRITWNQTHDWKIVSNCPPPPNTMLTITIGISRRMMSHFEWCLSTIIIHIIFRTKQPAFYTNTGNWMFVFNVSNKVCKLCVLLKLAVRNSQHRILLGCLTSEKNVMVQFGGRKNNASVIKIIYDQ